MIKRYDIRPRRKKAANGSGVSRETGRPGTNGGSPSAVGGAAPAEEFDQEDTGEAF